MSKKHQAPMQKKKRQTRIPENERPSGVEVKGEKLTTRVTILPVAWELAPKWGLSDEQVIVLAYAVGGRREANVTQFSLLARAGYFTTTSGQHGPIFKPTPRFMERTTQMFKVWQMPAPTVIKIQVASKYQKLH